jgi:hypothetical protein
MNQMRMIMVASAQEHPAGELETLIDQVWNDLQGQVSRATIQQALLEIIPKYQDATVTTFVPLFIRRDAVNTLRATLVRAEVEPATEKKPLPERTAGEPNPRGLQRLWRQLESFLLYLAVTER